MGFPGMISKTVVEVVEWRECVVSAACESVMI